MNNRLIRKDLARNRAVSLVIVLFITAASALLSLAATLFADLSGAVDQLMQDAKTPHFMQMHSGEIEMSELEAFVRETSDVEDFQVMEFLNIDNARMVLGDHSLDGNIQDNGFCTQSSRFDFLLDLNNQAVQPREGELYVPVCYYKDGTVQVGDQALIDGLPFTVAGFVRDSQMNSALASSKRFLVSEADFSRLSPSGNVEYLIEFRLHDPSGLSSFETAYSAAGLPSNGPALTLPLFRMLSAISDGIMIAVIVLIGLLVIFIAFLCIRFTLLAKIEDDTREIGVMKAIGMRLSDIRRIYLTLYAALAAAGSIAGYLLSFLLQKPLQENIRLNLGESSHSATAIRLGVLGMILVFLSVLFYVNWNLRCFRKISAAQAIRFGSQDDSAANVSTIRLSANRLFSTNFLLGLKDVLARKRLYATMLAVIVLASFIMIVPQNLYHTISGKDFVTYMGVGQCDLRLDIQQVSQLEEKTAVIGTYMDEDPGIARHAQFITKVYPLALEDGTTENIKVELGDHSVFPLQYAEGKMPEGEYEIALSAMNAEELEKGIGDSITLITASGATPLTICGIYSDITNGGKTAKAAFTDTSTEAAWSVICADLTGSGLLAAGVSDYAEHFPYAKVSSLDEYTAQTFGQTRDSVRTAALISILVAAAITLLVTLLSMKLLAAKDRYSIAVLRAIGFTTRDIRRQYTWRAALVLIAGVVLGTVLAGTLGEALSGIAVSSFGAATFHLTINLLTTYLLSPAILLFAALLATILGTLQAGEVHIYESIKE